MDQVIHDVGILNLPVFFGIDRGGLVEDGETHQGVFDIAHMRAVPNFRLFAPKDAKELRDMVYTLACERKGPAAIRFPRDKAINGDERPADAATLPGLQEDDEHQEQTDDDVDDVEEDDHFAGASL